MADGNALGDRLWGMDEVTARVMRALSDFEAERDRERLTAVIEAGLKPAGTTVDDLSPEEQVDYLDRDPEDVGLPADYGVVEDS